MKGNKNPNHPKSSHFVRDFASAKGRGIFNISSYFAENDLCQQLTQPPQAAGYSEINKKLSENMRLFDRWAKTYDKPVFQFWMRKFYQPALKLIDGGKVLDVSCGTGEFLRELAQRKKSKLYGTDISSQMIVKARKKLGNEAQLKKSDVHKLPFRNDYFDYVVSTESFHHYYDQQKALSEMKRVAKKGGKVVVVDINFVLQPIHWLFEKLEPGCVTINNRKEMGKLFQKLRFKNIAQYRSFIFSVLTVGVKS